jgi:hypothetical protein
MYHCFLDTIEETCYKLKDPPLSIYSSACLACNEKLEYVAFRAKTDCLSLPSNAFFRDKIEETYNQDPVGIFKI